MINFLEIQTTMYSAEIPLLNSEEASIVIIGSFNPQIFHPEWFLKHELISSHDYDRENDKESIFIHHDVAQFELNSNIRIEVFKDRFVARTPNRTDFNTLRDIVLGTFIILGETPVIKMGMNYKCVTGQYSKERWKEFGAAFCHLNKLKKVYDHTKGEPLDNLNSFGLFSQKILYPRNDDYNGAIFLDFSPNGPVPSRFLAFNVNSHIEFVNNDVDQVRNILEKDWENSINSSMFAIKKLIDLSKGS